MHRIARGSTPPGKHIALYLFIQEMAWLFRGILHDVNLYVHMTMNVFQMKD